MVSFIVIKCEDGVLVVKCCDLKVIIFYKVGVFVGKGGIWDLFIKNYYYIDI